MKLELLEKQALALLQQACCSYGILASPDEQDNYRRLWSRDSMIAGIAGLLAGNGTVMEGFRNSIVTLADYQHPRGMIPSNVLPDDSESSVSYGTLAGRVDATVWFTVGACLYLLNYPDNRLKKSLRPKLEKALTILDHWEFNGRGLLYTPLSGNWADEYPVEGHTLYDNALRLWGLTLYTRLYEDEERQKQAQTIRECIALNFWPRTSAVDHPGIYHRRAFSELAGCTPDHFACSIDPKGYNRRFDAAGHGLALLMGLAGKEQLQGIKKYINGIFKALGTKLVPAFWPVITEQDTEWDALRQNYSYDFKNRPNHFHNGGIWPVWMGWLALGMSTNGDPEFAQSTLEALMEIENPRDIGFREYISSDTLQPGGKDNLCFSASGLLFLIYSIKHTSIPKLYISRGSSH
ncbi:MAG: glycoside hydrolase 100 family protein [Balneolaceae bacterium]|jgi:hypothetical protein